MHTPTIMTLPFPDDGGGAWTAGSDGAASGGMGVGVITRWCPGLDSRGGGVFKEDGVRLTRPTGVPAGGVTLAPAPTFILKLLLPR
jgi:hypothetical protein